MDFGQRQIRIIQLAHDLVKRDGDGIGKVQASAVSGHRNAETEVQMISETVVRNTGAFLSEDQVDIVFDGREIEAAVGLFAVAGHVEIRARILALEILEILIERIVRVIEMIGCRPFQRLFAKFKSQRFDDVNMGIRGHAGTKDIARILRDLRLKKNYMYCHLFYHLLLLLTDLFPVDHFLYDHQELKQYEDPQIDQHRYADDRRKKIPLFNAGHRALVIQDQQ